MSHLIDILRNGAAFVVVLGILVFVHELGHYLAARWRGVHVEAFSIGFGPTIVSWRDRLGTVWKLSWLPLGGYVKLHGQERPEDVSPEVRASWIPGRTFQEKSVLSRAIVVGAGPVANFLLTIVLFAGLFVAIGRPVPVPVLGEVTADGAASAAGLQAGDRVKSIGGTAVSRFDELQKIVVASAGRTLDFVLERDGATLTKAVTIGTRPGGGERAGLLGVRGGTVEFVSEDPLRSVWAGFTQTWDVTVTTLEGLGQMLSGKRTTDELSGPLGIAKMSGQVAQLGLSSFISFIAILSVNLGLINLFPIPVLDGGHLMFYLAEAVRGRPLPPRVQEYGFRAGFAMLAGLFVFATWNDVKGYTLFRWVAGLIG